MYLYILVAYQSESDLHEVFCLQKTIMAHCSLLGNFSGNVAGFNVYK